MNQYFETRVLTKAIVQLNIPEQLLQTKIFTGKNFDNDSDVLQFDIYTFPKDVLPFVGRSDPGVIVDNLVRTTKVIEAPRLRSKKFIEAADLDRLRAFGSSYAKEKITTKINRELTDLKYKIARTLEKMAAEALTGIIRENDGSSILIDFGMPATHKPNTDWTSDTADILGDIRNWKKLIQRDSGLDARLAIVGFNTMSYLLKNQTIRDLAKTKLGAKMVTKETLGLLAGVDEIIEYNAGYVNGSGNFVPFIPENAFILVGVDKQAQGIEYAPIVDLKANVMAKEFFSKSWETEDPSGRWLLVESRPLPVLYMPTSVVYATVA